MPTTLLKIKVPSRAFWCSEEPPCSEWLIKEEIYEYAEHLYGDVPHVNELESYQYWQIIA